MASLSCIAKTNGDGQETVKENDTLYIIDQGRKYVVDSKVIRVKPKDCNFKLSTLYKVNYTSKSGCHYIEVPAGMDIEKFYKSLKDSHQYEIVDYVSECKLLYEPNDPDRAYQWYVDNINLEDAWNITKGDPNVKVAVLDFGVDRDYEDLGFSSNSNYSNISYTLGYDYVNHTQYSTPQYQHGTYVANVIGAKTNNGIDGCGIAGGNNCPGVTLISYRVSNAYNLIQAINQAVEDGAKVLNLSISLANNTDVDDAIAYAYDQNVSIVCATGNDSLSSLSFPASNNLTIAVGASNSVNRRCTFSNYGDGLDLVAPGQTIYIHDDSLIPAPWHSTSGTSLAAPMVSGTIALMLSVNPNLTPSEIRNILHNSATKGSYYNYNSGYNSEVGYGFLNTYAAVLYASLKINGLKYISDEETYEIDNLPSGHTVEWYLSDSYYNQNCLEQDEPSANQCTITCSSSHIMMNATLTANIKHNNVTVRTLKKTVCAYDRFRGHYTSGNISADIDYTYVLHVKPNYNTIITSPILLGASVSYSSSGLTPLYWGFSPSSGEINVTMPTNNNNIPIILNIDDICGNHYTLYLFPTSNRNINVSNEGNCIIVSPNEKGDKDRGWSIDQPWAVEVRNAITGRQMATISSMSLSETISTVGWPNAVYIVKVTIGKEEMTEKVIVDNPR